MKGNNLLRNIASRVKQRKMPIVFVLMISLASGDSVRDRPADESPHDHVSTQCCLKAPRRFAEINDRSLNKTLSNKVAADGMIYIPGGIFDMGADNEQASRDEYPKHAVQISAFYIDATEVTNGQFKKFVDATGYVTTAEQKPDWEELKKSLPAGTARPSEEILQPASLVFKRSSGPVDLNDYSLWWNWVPGADWEHPQGPGSGISGKDNYPAVHVSWYDAMAYCKWAGKDLPTEAQWEYAARGRLKNHIYPWGNEHVNAGSPKANTWEGTFPYFNAKKDGFETLAPVKTFLPNGYGLYDMAGNAWEWCSDWYDARYYESISSNAVISDPQGPSKSYDPQEPYMQKRSLRGGSFLCNDTYCSGYRAARRMKSSPDTGFEHTGFRCVNNLK